MHAVHLAVAGTAQIVKGGFQIGLGVRDFPHAHEIDRYIDAAVLVRLVGSHHRVLDLCLQRVPTAGLARGRRVGDKQILHVATVGRLDGTAGAEVIHSAGIELDILHHAVRLRA